MATVATLLPTSNPSVHYARLRGSLEGYAVRPSAEALYFIDHDSHVYAILPNQGQALTLLGAVPAVECANVLAALQRCAEVCG